MKKNFNIIFKLIIINFKKLLKTKLLNEYYN